MVTGAPGFPHSLGNRVARRRAIGAKTPRPLVAGGANKSDPKTALGTKGYRAVA